MAEEAKVEAVAVEVKTKIKKERYTPELDKQILELKQAGKSVSEIAKQFNRTPAGVTYRFRKLDPKVKTEAVAEVVK